MVYFYCAICKSDKTHTYHGQQLGLDLYRCDGCGDCRSAPQSGQIQLSNDANTGQTIAVNGDSWTYPDKVATRKMLEQPGEWGNGRRTTKRGLFG